MLHNPVTFHHMRGCNVKGRSVYQVWYDVLPYQGMQYTVTGRSVYQVYEVIQSYICNTQVGQFIRFYNCMNLFSDIRGCHKQVGQIIRYCVKLKSHIRGCNTQVDLYQHVSHLLIKFINCNCSTGYLELAVQNDDRQFCGLETL